MNNEGKRHARQKYVKKKVEEEKAAEAKYQGNGMSERSPSRNKPSNQHQVKTKSISRKAHKSRRGSQNSTTLLPPKELKQGPREGQHKKNPRPQHRLQHLNPFMMKLK